MAPHVRHDLGGSDQTVGLVIGVFSFVALAARFVSGPLTDRRGPKIAFLSGLVSCALAGFAYVLPMGLSGAYIGRILQGFGEACLYTGAAAWVIEVAGIHRSGQALGFLSSGIWGGISAGPVIGQWLGSFHAAALLQVIAALAACAILARVPDDYQPTPHPQRRRWIPPRLVAPGIAVGLVNVHYPVITGFLILHLARHGNSGPGAFSAYALLVLASRFFLGGLPDRVNPAITYYGGLAAMALGLSVLAAGPAPALAVGATALLGFGFSFPWASVAGTVLRSTPAGERGSTVSFLSVFYDLFVGASSFAAGAVANRFGYAAAFLMAVAAVAAAAIAGQFVFAVRAKPAVAETCWLAPGAGIPFRVE
jgi:MFS family permease